MSFAVGTTVPIEKTRAEIEKLVTRFGASEFGSMRTAELASIQFLVLGRRVRFTLTLPNQDWARKKLAGGRRRTPVADAVDAEHRRRWRCLLLAIRAKLEVVESGIATFDEEFLAHVVMDDGKTVYEKILFMNENGRPMLPPVEH